MIPSSEDIQCLQVGDIITIHFNPQIDLFLESKSKTSKFDESFLPVKMHYVGCDQHGNIVAAVITKYILDNQSYEFTYNNFGNPFYFITKKLEELSFSEKIEVDLQHCLYIDKEWIFEVEKRQLKNSDSGIRCCECNEFYRYAVPNLSNGNLACWNCRDLYKWKYSKLYVGGK